VITEFDLTATSQIWTNIEGDNSGAGFTDALRGAAAADPRILLVTPDDLYAG
jgi:hypothetical protein